MNCPKGRIHVVSSAIKAVSKEVSGLGGKSRPSLLRKTSKEDLQNFDLQKLCEEWQEREPIFYAFLLNTSLLRSRLSGCHATLPLSGSVARHPEKRLRRRLVEHCQPNKP